MLQAGEDDLARQLLGLLAFALGVVVVENQGMQIPVPGVEDVGDPQAVPPGELGDLTQDCRELRARDDAVLDVVVVGDAAHSTESGLAGLPEECAFVVVLGHPDLRGLVLLADLQHPSELFLYLASGPSSSMTSTAPASGRPGCTAASTASMVKLSIISMAAGIIPSPMILETAPPAPSVSSKPASKVRTASGTRHSRSVILVAIPSVPSEPTKAPSRS